MAYCIINGELLNSDEASIGITDLAIQRGYGIFDYFKILEGRPVFLEGHLNRFYNSASHMRLEVPCTRESLKQMIFRLIEKNALPDSGMKLLLTGGYSTDGFAMGAPNLVITHGPLPSYGNYHENGIRIITHQHQRQMPTIKTIDYLMAVWLQPLLKERGAQDVIYHDGSFITECPRSNIFIVTKDDRIVTPAKNVLNGIIRSQLLKMSNVYPVSEGDISLPDLFAAREVFVTSTTKNILSVSQVDAQLINDGQPGEVTLKLTAALHQRIKDWQRYSDDCGISHFTIDKTG